MMLAEFSMFPLDKGESLSTYVARSLDLIDSSGLQYKVGPMGTTVEGDWDEVMALIKRCYERMRKDCKRVECSIKIDYREGSSGRIAKKIESVEKKLGRRLKV